MNFEGDDSGDRNIAGSDYSSKGKNYSGKDYASKAGKDYTGKAKVGKDYSDKANVGKDYSDKANAGKDYTDKANVGKDYSDKVNAGKDYAGKDYACDLCTRYTQKWHVFIFIFFVMTYSESKLCDMKNVSKCFFFNFSLCQNPLSRMPHLMDSAFPNTVEN